MKSARMTSGHLLEAVPEVPLGLDAIGDRVVPGPAQRVQRQLGVGGIVLEHQDAERLRHVSVSYVGRRACEGGSARLRRLPVDEQPVVAQLPGGLGELLEVHAA